MLHVTSTLMPDTADATQVQPFWQVGYGYVDAKAAVDLVSRKRYTKDKALARFQSQADQRVLGDRDESVLSTDYWTYAAAPATFAAAAISAYAIAGWVTPAAAKAARPRTLSQRRATPQVTCPTTVSPSSCPQCHTSAPAPSLAAGKATCHCASK